VGKKIVNFWDFSAPIYDFVEKTNGKAYGDMLTLVRDLEPIFKRPDKPYQFSIFPRAADFI